MENRVLEAVWSCKDLHNFSLVFPNNKCNVVSLYFMQFYLQAKRR